MIWDGINKRRFPRVNYKCLIRISKGEQEEVIETYTDKPISCNATIVWVVTRRPAGKHEKITYDTGIEFANISDEDRERVSQLVDEIIKTEA